MFHVYPSNEEKEHNLLTENGMIFCKCGATIKDMIVIHNSFDGREIIEEVYDLLKNIDNAKFN